jgi:[protein-PII] uridylyltransferase
VVFSFPIGFFIVSSLDHTLSPKRSDTIKTLLDEEGTRIREAHFSGSSGGEVVQRRTGLIDRALREAYSRLAATGPGPMPALLAIGGYGRGELNPHSDIDIMFLCRDQEDRKRSPELLYRLWDAGLDIGYSVRSTQECVSLARQDIKIRTSLIESRLLAGDPALYASFLRSMQSDVFFLKASSFITEKISERNTTRQKYVVFILHCGYLSCTSEYLRLPILFLPASLRMASTPFFCGPATFSGE